MLNPTNGIHQYLSTCDISITTRFSLPTILDGVKVGPTVDYKNFGFGQNAGAQIKAFGGLKSANQRYPSVREEIFAFLRVAVEKASQGDVLVGLFRTGQDAMLGIVSQNHPDHRDIHNRKLDTFVFLKAPADVCHSIRSLLIRSPQSFCDLLNRCDSLLQNNYGLEPLRGINLGEVPLKILGNKDSLIAPGIPAEVGLSLRALVKRLTGNK